MALQDALHTAVSGLDVNARRAEVAADNIVNVTTPGFVPSEVQVTTVGGPRGDAGAADFSGAVRAVVRPKVDDVTVSQDVSRVDLTQEFTNLMLAEKAYRSSATVVRMAADMMESVLDEEF